MPRIAVVTPYYRETDEVLRQCHESVLNQTRECTHILVADGHPKAIFDGSPRTLHVPLPASNGDNGNTPRAIGGILAEAYGFDGVAYLDADNWYEPTHIESLLAGHQATGHPLVCCKRQFFTQDGRLLPIREVAEDANQHVDTSCWLVMRPAFPLLRAWLMPKVLGPVCDRVFFQKAIRERYMIYALNSRTVAFRSQYEAHYRRGGVEVPPGLKASSDTPELKACFSSADGVRAIVDALGFFPVLF